MLLKTKNVRRIVNRQIALTLVAFGILTGVTTAQIYYETGSLKGFLGGNCPNCVYDNWISHISEGIANSRLNDYGPVELDPQTNGFGRYERILEDSAGNQLIDSWYNIFSLLLQGDINIVHNELISSCLDSIYQLVVLSDYNMEYYILREKLNPEYYDDQLTPDDSTDDVRGSFDYGWGVYVFSPSSANRHIIVEMPHPCDDYISPFVGVDIFEMLDAGFLMIAGAGREVLWTNEGEYNNSKSLSDPSRNSQTVFHAAHRAFVDYHPNNFAIQLHSFDTVLHQGLRSVVLSAGPDDPFPNEPILDRCAYDDMISLTPYIVVPTNTCGTHQDVMIDRYYQLFYEGGYAYQGTSPVIPINNELPGYNQNRQILYSHLGHNTTQDPENFIHIELDEFPDLIEDTITVFYNTALPGVATFDNYINAVQYYRPAFQALQLAMAQPPMVELIAATPPVLYFAPIPVDSSDTLSAAFQNISPSDTLIVLGASVNNAVFAVIEAPAGDTLFPGGVCSVTVAFNPQNAQNYNQNLTFSTNEGCSYLPMIGTGLGAYAVLSPPVVNFGPVAIEQSDSMAVYLRNAGNYPMRLLSLLDSPPHFLVSAPIDSLCPPGQQIRFQVIFHPLEIGFFQDTLWVITDAFRNDTLPLFVQGEGGLQPAAPEELCIIIERPEIHLSWKPVTETVNGFPIEVNGYNIYYSENPNEEFRFLMQSPETEVSFPLEEPVPPRMFFQVTAVIE